MPIKGPKRKKADRPVPQKFLRPRHYATRSDINWRTIYRYVDEGLLPAYKFNGVLLLDVDECDALLKGNRS